MGSTDLTPYSPRLLLGWEQEDPSTRHRAAEGTLVFADVSGFTRLSERLARTRGKAGAEEMTDTIGALFGDLLTVAAARGGEMLKYGGDAVLLFFRGEHHVVRAAAAASELQQRLRAIGRVETAAGPVRLRMSIGMHSGTFDLFKVGRRHGELIVAGPSTTETVRMEAAADAGETLLSAATAALLAPRCLGAHKEGGRLLRRPPEAPTVPIVPAPPEEVAERFVSEALRAYLGGGEVVAEHRLATVAFVHLMGVDDLLRDLGPAVVADRLDDTITIVQDALADLGVSFLATDLAADGAKVMAAAGAPFAADDDGRRMLIALRRIVDAGTPLPIRAGVNRGHVFAASVGPRFRQTYTTMGDVTNTAARLLGHAAAGEILALRTVVETARAGVLVEERAPFHAKGKAEPVVPYAIASVIDPQDEELTGARLPLTGRGVELETVLAAASSARAGTGVMIELIGDMGAGKSRLVEELLASASDLQAYVVRCEPYERTTPFHPIRRLLERLVATDPRELQEQVADVAPALVPWLSLLGGILDLELPETDETRLLEPKYRLQRAASVTVELLRAICPGPTVFVVEDVHWLDDASAAVLRELEASVTSSPWLVCVTSRNEASTFVPTRAETSLVQLAPLSDLAMSQLISAATLDAPLPPHRRDALVERAAGNPLFLCELLEHGLADDELPESVEMVMAAQIDRLPPADRRLLRYAAVLGSRFEVTLLAELADDPDLTTSSARALAARLQALAVPDGRGRLRFRHQLIRDVAYESLPFRLRRELHGRAGDAIERAGGSATERASTLSLHYLHARRYDACWSAARTAAARACEQHANVEAVELLERALTAARHLDDVDPADLASTWEELATRHTHLGNTGRATDALRQARRLSRHDPLETARLCATEARIREREGDPMVMLRWLRRGLAAIAGRDDLRASSIRAELLVLQAWTKLHQGRLRPAHRLAGLALAEAEAADNAWAIAGASVALDNAAHHLGLPRDPERAQRAIAIYEELGRLSDQAMVLINCGADAAQQSRWRDALELNGRGRDLLVRTGNLVEAAYGSFNMAEVLIDQGRVEEAEAILDEVSSLWRSVDHTLGLVYLQSHRGRLHLQRGDAAAALESFRAAEEAFVANGLGMYTIDVQGRAAECLLRLGDVEAADAAIAEAITRDHAAGTTPATPLLLRVRACCRLAAGARDDATADLVESAGVARSRSAGYDLLLALEWLAAIDGSALSLADEADRERLRASLDVVFLPTPPVAAAGRDGAGLAELTG